jgi:hypothetical protein
MGWVYFLGGEGDSVIDKNNPGQAEQYAGRRHKTDLNMLVQLVYPGRITTYSLSLKPLRSKSGVPSKTVWVAA